MFNKYDDREHSGLGQKRNTDKIGQTEVKDALQNYIQTQFKGAGKNAVPFQPKEIFQVKGNAPREAKFQMLAGANNNREQWWKNEGAPESTRDKDCTLKVTGPTMTAHQYRAKR